MTQEKTRRAPALLSRRTALKGASALAGLGLASRFAWAAGSDAPLRIGFQAHRTGIGAAYGRWYEQTAQAAARLINSTGGIAGRPVELVVEDDGTDPRRGAEVVEKFATAHKVDFVFGTLFSHVVVAAAPRAGDLKMPYLVVSEGYHVPSGSLNRYVFQPCITDVRAQIQAVAPWIFNNLGKKVTVIFPDYAFGYNHRDFFSAAAAQLGGQVRALIPVPPTESSFTRYFPQIPADTDVLYHVMVGPGVLTFVRELGQHFGRGGPALFGFVDSLEAVDIATPGLEYLEGSHLWEGFPRYAGPGESQAAAAYRGLAGVGPDGASLADPGDISTYSHMFGCWETLFVIKQAVEASGYRGPADRPAFIEALEAIESLPEGIEHPQGPKKLIPAIHQGFGHQYISRVADGRLQVVHRSAIEDSMYPPEADYRTQPL